MSNLKSYSGSGVYDEKVARSRRRDLDRGLGFCPGNYTWRDPVGKLHKQLEADLNNIYRAADETNVVVSAQWFEGSMERWLDGYPYTDLDLSLRLVLVDRKLTFV